MNILLLHSVSMPVIVDLSFPIIIIINLEILVYEELRVKQGPNSIRHEPIVNVISKSGYHVVSSCAPIFR